MPKIQYYLPGDPHPITPASDAWQTPLPLDRFAAESPDTPASATGWSHGDYFEAAQKFLANHQCGILTRAVSSTLEQPVSGDDIKEVRITIIKHGAFYHPALIAVHGPWSPVFLVLNTAVSPLGRQTIQGEFAALERLNRGGGASFIPSVYGCHEMRTRNGRQLYMFLGDWFDGFSEFHLSRASAEATPGIRVWDESRGFFFLTDEQTRALYREAAYILAAHYNPVSFEQIFPWHHAAGDFVVQADGDHVRVRLITVRQYAPLFRDIEPPADPAAAHEQMMTALLVFVLNLSIRMRIDRLDGTGELVWAGEETVTPVWEGIIAGIAGCVRPNALPENFLTSFQHYLADCDVSDVFDLARATAGGFHPQAPERALIETQLMDHVATLWAIIEHTNFRTRM